MAEIVRLLDAFQTSDKYGVATPVNIIIAEENSELHIITGCSVHHQVSTALHLGVSEFYVKKGAKITFTMVHNWSKEAIARRLASFLAPGNGTRR